jgi:hypothetical protein
VAPHKDVNLSNRETFSQQRPKPKPGAENRSGHLRRVMKKMPRAIVNSASTDTAATGWFALALADHSWITHPWTRQVTCCHAHQGFLCQDHTKPIMRCFRISSRKELNRAWARFHVSRPYRCSYSTLVRVYVCSSCVYVYIKDTSL